MTYCSYVYQTSSKIYYFRIKIPASNRQQFNNQGEIRRTLKTRSKREAMRLAQELAIAYQSRFKMVDKRHRIDLDDTVKFSPIVISNNVEKIQSTTSEGLLLSDCIKIYLENIQLKNKLKGEFVLKEKKPIFERLLEIIGDRNINEITFLDASKFLAKLQ